MKLIENKCFKIAAGVIFPLAVAIMIYWAICIRVPLPCVIYENTGMFCSSCGATRSVICLLSGDITSALRNNFMVTLAIIPASALMIYLYIGIIFGYLGRMPHTVNLGISVLVLIFAVLFLVFGIIRNIPVYPFTYLTPI